MRMIQRYIARELYPLVVKRSVALHRRLDIGPST